MSTAGTGKRRTREISDHGDSQLGKKIKLGSVADATVQLEYPVVVKRPGYIALTACAVNPSVETTAFKVRNQDDGQEFHPPKYSEFSNLSNLQQQLFRTAHDSKQLSSRNHHARSTRSKAEVASHVRTSIVSEVEQPSSYEESPLNATGIRENRKYSIIKSMIVVVLLWSNIVMAAVGLQQKSFDYEHRDISASLGDVFVDMEYALFEAKRKTNNWKSKAAYYRSSFEALHAGLEHCKSRLRSVEEDLQSVQQHNNCADYVLRCHEWASQDECNKNPGFMHRECALSCGVCDHDS